ncbi:MAG: PKD domain-containing protein [Bacteroidales bacterium]
MLRWNWQGTAVRTNINPVAGCEVLTVQFYDNSSGVVSRSWNFGDGSAVSNAQNPTHSFNAGIGDTTYTVTLNITCASGTNSSQILVTVYAKPSIDFTPDRNTVCAITDSVCIANHSPYSSTNTYLWNFGDGTISTAYQPCKIYSTAGMYTLEHTVTNQYGCVNSAEEEDYINVIPVPNTAFSVSEYVGCHPFAALQQQHRHGGNTYTNWIWDYGDGQSLEQSFESPPHTFVNPGKYDVFLSTTNSLGCSNFSTQTITVKRSPTALFQASTPICGYESSLVEFFGIASDTAHFDWDFPDA